MKIQPYINKLNNSKEFKSFSKKYEDAYLIAGFFVLDFEQGKHMHQIDFYVPSEKKIAAFSLDAGVQYQLLDMMHQKVPDKLDIKTNIDLDSLQGILQDEMKNRGYTEEIKKIIAILQNIDGKKIWNLNCVLSGMEILKAHVEDESESVLKMEKASILNYIQKMSPTAIAELQKKAQLSQPNINEKDDKSTKKKIEQLEKLKGALNSEIEKIKEKETKSKKK